MTINGGIWVLYSGMLFPISDRKNTSYGISGGIIEMTLHEVTKAYIDYSWLDWMQDVLQQSSLFHG